MHFNKGYSRNKCIGGLEGSAIKIWCPVGVKSVWKLSMVGHELISILCIVGFSYPENLYKNVKSTCKWKKSRIFVSFNRDHDSFLPEV